MYIPSADMGEYDEWKAPITKKKVVNGRQASQTQISRGSSRTQLTKETYQEQNNRGSVQRGTSRTELLRGSSQSQLSRGTSKGELLRGTSSSQLNTRKGRPTSMYGSLDRQSSSSKLSNSFSSSCAVHDESQESQQSQRRRSKQDIDEGQDSGPCSMHYGSLDRQASRGQLKRQQSSLGRQGSRKNISGGCSMHEEERETYQHNKPKWQDSLRGSSSPVKPSTAGDGERRGKSYELGTQASRAKQSSKQGESFPPRKRSQSKPTSHRASRSKSRSPDRLYATTYSSRAKQSEAIEQEEPTYLRKNSRSSKSPMRSRTNSTSSIHRRSKSPRKRSTSAKRRSMSNFSDECEDGPDPLASYTSFNQFRADRTQGGQTSNKAERAQKSIVQSTTSTSRKISDSYTATQEFNLSSVKKSSFDISEKKVSSSYNGMRRSESHNSNERKESFNRNGIENSSTLGYNSNSTESNRFMSSYPGKSGYSSNGYPDTTLSFPNGVGRTLTGAYKTNDVLPSYPPRESAHTYSPPLSASRTYSDQKFESSGKISLGSLKKPSIESWDSSRSSTILRKGVSTTYIG